MCIRDRPKGGERLFEICSRLGFVPLASVAQIRIGFVTGCDDYFVLSEADIEKWKLPTCCLVSVLGSPKQRYGLTITAADWRENRDAGAEVFLLTACAVHRVEPGAALNCYLEHGIAQGVHQRFKCKQRTPWFAVPLSERPSCFLTYMSYRIPRLIVNDTLLSAPNRLHYISFRAPVTSMAIRRFAFAFANPLTLATCEIAGRAYGGGVLKLEPSDCANVLVPDPGSVQLNQIPEARIAKVDELLRSDREKDAESLVASTLGDAFGISGNDVAFAKRLHSQLRNRRLG